MTKEHICRKLVPLIIPQAVLIIILLKICLNQFENASSTEAGRKGILLWFYQRIIATDSTTAAGEDDETMPLVVWLIWFDADGTEIAS